ncbi:PREDICTED: zinc finger protein 91 isoform X1 [Polistes dominula]|uniref:Zinc finger protein 91 isoform X1 n=2 Tax=Polistes dominula TaxID=743375 RepID=A0ABM1I3C5_POLDO|nr:PREDICTED: zinc finger protein 91 isoform X1 [Polistes dominula]
MDAVEISTSNPPQNEQVIVSAVEICRICLHGNLAMRDLFLGNEIASLSAKAMSFANVKMLPGDGLPPHICNECTDKLESAYEFKLQVEQADNVLREKFDGIKEELFFNEVEVHLEVDRSDAINDIHLESHYQHENEGLTEESENEKSLLKEQLALLHVEKLVEREQLREEENNSQILEQQNMINSSHSEEKFSNEIDEDTCTLVDNADNQGVLKSDCINENCTDAIPAEEHDYIMQQDYVMNEQFTSTESKTFSKENTTQCNESLMESNILETCKIETEHIPLTNNDTLVEKDVSTTEIRKSKRRSSRRNFTSDRDSDEENYFENLNLSSRLKKAQADKSEKVYFMCYLCDKQFLSKNVLKEHMHSHEEIRRALSLKKVPEKSPKVSNTSPKMPPSGKRPNKCSYCGKEYLYIISFNKHLKRHEKEKENAKDDSMPLEISFHEDENSLGFDNHSNSQHSDYECRKRTKGEEESYNENEEDDQETDKHRKKSHLEIFECNKCSEKFYTRRSLRKHTLSHVNLKCNICNEKFDELEQLKNHRAKHVVEGMLMDQDLEDNIEHHVINKEDEEEDKGDNEDDSEVENNIEDAQEKEMKESKCQHCTSTCSHKKSLSRHTDMQTVSKYNCKICCQQFTRKDHLRRHMEQHGRIKTYKCTQCNKTFGNELTLRNHLIATNHKTFVHGQEYDPNKRIKRVAAKAAQKIIDKIKTEDGLEDYDEDDNNDLIDVHHNRKNENSLKKANNRKELECATCNKKCSSKHMLTKHMEQHVKDEKADKMDKLDRFKKPQEKKEQQRIGGGMELRKDEDDDDDNSDFESGLDWLMDNHECATCKKRYSTKKSLLRHQLLHEEPNFECDICNVKFYRKDKLKAHYDKCSEKNPDQVRKCNICGDSFENNEILRQHRAKHVTEGILTEEDLREIEPCPEERKQGEKIIRKRRTDIVGLECTECNKHYTSRKGLLRHIQVHEGKKYLCDICPKKFYRREHLKIHVAKHNMIKPYKCTRCTKRFIKEEQLTNHLSKHDRPFKKNKETDSSKRFLCEICSKSFTQSTTLIAHLRAHNGIKPYVCEVCSRPFTTNAYLKMHMRTHTQERPYICQYCSRAFARADTLANHLTSHTGEAKYHCKYCPKNFRRLKSLKEHVFIHTGQRPYACPTCDRRFNNNGSRYAHSKRCKQNFLQNQNRIQTLTEVQTQQPSQRIQQTLTQTQVVKSQNIKTITITRQAEPVTTQQIMQHQEIVMPLILPFTVTLADVSDEVILPEGTKIFTTS